MKFFSTTVRTLTTSFLCTLCILGALLAVPLSASAGAFWDSVSCASNPGQCGLCNVIELGNVIISWLVGILVLVFGVVAVVAGFGLVTSGGNSGEKDRAKKRMTNAFIGFIIVLAAWLAIDTLFQGLTGGGIPAIACVEQPRLENVAIYLSSEVRPMSASPENRGAYSAGDGANLANIITSSGDLATDIENAAIANGITDPAVINILKAQIAQESSGCQNEVGPATQYGRAYGCGQILLSTARNLDPSGTSGLSDAQLADKLVQDDAYNLSLHSQYMNQLIQQNNGNVDYALAAYNGGGVVGSGCSSGAACDSVACPGALQYQCPYETPGCWDSATQQPNGNTGCGAEDEFTDFYYQTGNYVKKINAGAENF